MFNQMIDFSFRRGLTLVGSSALLLLSTLGMSGAKAQPLEAVEPFGVRRADSQTLAQRVVPPLRTRLSSQASLGQVESGNVSVTLTNNSPDRVTYQSTTIPTDTLELMPGEQQTFDNVSVPMTIVFYQKDGSLISADVTNVNPQEDSFEVEFTAAATLGDDERSIVLLESGNIYLY